MNAKCLALFLPALFAASGHCQTGKIKIGVSSSLTGNAATYGIDIKNTLLFANEKLSGDKYELVFEDDKCNGKDAVSVAHRFIDVLKLKYVTGLPCSGTVLSTAQIYNNAGVLSISTAASAAEISKAGVFRTWKSDDEAAQELYRYVSKRHKKVGAISEQTDYAQGFLRSFEKGNERKEIEIISESFFTDEIDLKPLILKLKANNIDALFINPQTERTLLIALKQALEVGIESKIYSTYYAGTPSFLSEAKGSAEGIIFVDSPSVRDVVSQEGLKLFEDFESQFGPMNSIELIFVTAFEAFRALHQAIEHGGDLRSYLHSTTFHGLFGDWRFDEQGDIQGYGFVLKTISQGKPLRLK